MTDPASSPLTPAVRLHLVTLGVRDLAQSVAFYDGLGLKRRGSDHVDVAFFEAGHVVLSLYPRGALARDMQVSDIGMPETFHGITLACNLESREQVDTLMARAGALGARVLRPGQPVFWGGYMGYFADPDGHVWEVAFNPFFPFDANGRLMVPD